MNQLKNFNNQGGQHQMFNQKTQDFAPQAVNMSQPMPTPMSTNPTMNANTQSFNPNS